MRRSSLPDKNIPVALFDCIIDNLIDNALRKRQSEPGITISVEIQPEPLRLIACDSGDPIPENIAENLLRGAVVSETWSGDRTVPGRAVGRTTGLSADVDQQSAWKGVL